MEFLVVAGESEERFDISDQGGGVFRLRSANGEESLLEGSPLADGSWALVWQHRVLRVAISQDAKKNDLVWLNGRQHTLQLLDARAALRRAAQKLAPAGDGPEELTAPMPGKVVTVLVREGDAVKEGQGLVVIEAMKMENELRSPKTGVVTSVMVEAGKAVESGALLCVVE